MACRHRDVRECNLIEWVEKVKSNMLDFAIIAGDKTALAKAKMKSYYDKSAKCATDLEPGSMVLVRTPGLTSKFADSWTGPYEVMRKVTPVTYELLVPDSV